MKSNNFFKVRFIKLKQFFFIVTGMLFIYSCKDNRISFTNSLNQSREDEIIIIRKDELADLIKEIPENMVPAVSVEPDLVIPSQTDDLDSDGKWDELVFAYSFSPNETVVFTFDFVAPADAPKYTTRTNVHFGIRKNANEPFTKVTNHRHTPEYDKMPEFYKYQFEGPGWENDKVGFRIYFDERNGIDIWGKIISDMVLNNVQDQNYHVLSSWGMDILKVGNTLGAGSLAMSDGDSLYRLAEKKPGDKSFRLISNGPVRSIFRLVYDNWDVKGKNYQLTQDFIINGGAYCYESNVTLSGDFDSTNLVTGITTLHLPSDSMINKRAITKNYYCVSTFGQQSENNDKLGMAIIAHKTDFNGFGIAPNEAPGNNIVKTAYVKLKAIKDKPAHFRFFACWEQSSMPFGYRANFNSHLYSEALRLENPLIIE